MMMKHIDKKALQHKRVAFKADSVSDEGRFSGYGSIFGNTDLGGEIVAKGAFSDSLKRITSSGDPLPALWQHKSDQPIGGYDLLAEDDNGLKVEGFLLSNDIPLAAQALALMKRRVVKGLSIGYYIEEYSWNDKEGILTLLKLDLREISIVTFPMNVEAQIETVKNIMGSGKLPTLKEFEDLLCEAGFSKTQAKAVAGNGLRKLLDRCEADGNPSDPLAVLKAFSLQ
jgi:uncharacterized protein